VTRSVVTYTLELSDDVDGAARQTQPARRGPTVHELSICDAIARVVLDHAGDHDVRSVRVRVGALRQIVPEALTFCWDVVSRRPQLAGSRLEVDHVPGVVDCPSCGTRSTLTEFVLRCPECGTGPVRVVSGEEFLVTSIDVASDGATTDGATTEDTPADGTEPVGGGRKEE
jgi:hydrogenase nickel incorporation protein HypA/HybF